mmetsp:Transcript_6721/g.15352  ORF Transcript_6721/g.15352 Transcript_6721/m.15352 type:complete len:103 (+) Transcript_6721:88-396(+)
MKPLLASSWGRLLYLYQASPSPTSWVRKHCNTSKTSFSGQNCVCVEACALSPTWFTAFPMTIQERKKGDEIGGVARMFTETPPDVVMVQMWRLSRLYVWLCP